MRVYGTPRLSACTALACALLASSLGCGGTVQEPRPPAGRPALVATPLAIDAPAVNDAPPQWSLAFEYPDGTRTPIADRAVAYAPFRDGVALIDSERRLYLISPDGSRRMLTSTSATTPVPGPSGELYYVALYGAVAELHELSAAGRDEVIARELSSIALISPEADGSVLLLGAKNGGVAGVWRVAPGEHTASCITNCELVTGQAWGDRFVAPPGTAEELAPAYRAARTIETDDPGVVRGEP